MWVSRPVCRVQPLCCVLGKPICLQKLARQFSVLCSVQKALPCWLLCLSNSQSRVRQPRRLAKAQIPGSGSRLSDSFCPERTLGSALEPVLQAIHILRKAAVWTQEQSMAYSSLVCSHLKKNPATLARQLIWLQPQPDRPRL